MFDWPGATLPPGLPQACGEEPNHQPEKNMKTLLIAFTLGACLALSSACATGHEKAATAANSMASADSTASVEQALLKFERDGAEAQAKNDLPWAERNLPDDFTYTTADGQMITKSQLLGMIKSGDLKYESVEAGNLKVTVYGDAAVVTGTQTYKAQFKGQPINSHERFTDTFIKRNGHWEPVASHASAIAKQ